MLNILEYVHCESSIRREHVIIITIACKVTSEENGEAKLPEGHAERDDVLISMSYGKHPVAPAAVRT